MKFRLVVDEEFDTIKAILDSALEKINDVNVDYWRINFGLARYFGDTIDSSVEDTKVSRTYSTVAGVGVFVYSDGGIGFASSNFISLSEIKRLFRRAIKLAKVSRAFNKITLKLPDKFVIPKTSPPSVIKKPSENQEFSEILLEVNDYIRKAMRFHNSLSVKNLTGNIGFYVVSRGLIDSLGRNLEYTFPVYATDFSVVIGSNGKIFEGFDSAYAISGEEALNSKRYSPMNISKRALDTAINNSLAEKLEPGVYSVVSSPELTGVIAHESFGHLSEADSVIDKSSYLVDAIGKEFGNDDLNILDTGNYVKGGIWLPFDDEGVPTREVYLMKNGVFTSYLHSVLTASIMNSTPTGNGRASSPMTYPIVRMRNTYLLPGKDRKDEIFEEMKQGVYIESVEGGETEDSGFFVFTARRAFYIKDGEIKTPLKNISIRGHISSFLRNVKMISQEIDVQIGFCEKNDQTVIVGLGGPYLLVEKAVLGGK